MTSWYCPSRVSPGSWYEITGGGHFDYVGAPIAHHKTEAVLTFLGIQVDTNLSQLSLPLEKVARLQEILSHWRGRKSCTKKDLQILLGHLSHAAIVFRPGRIFLRTLFTLLSRLADPCHYTHLNLKARTDTAWWQCLLLHWNCRSFFPQQTLHSTFTLMPQGHLVAKHTAQSCHYGSNYHGLSHGLQLA